MQLRKLAYYKGQQLVLRGLLRCIGPWQWLRLMLAFRPVCLRMRGFRSGVLVRPGTSDVLAFHEIFVRGTYGWLQPETDPRLIVDVGANAGYASVAFANRWPEADIIAVEPEASNVALCRRNLELYPRASVVQAALWSRPGRLRIANPHAGKWAFQVRPDESGEIVAMTIDQLAAGRRIDVLKIDVEGAEREVFANAPAWIADVGAIAVETETHEPPTRTVVAEALEQYGRSWSFRDSCMVSQDLVAEGSSAR